MPKAPILYLVHRIPFPPNKGDKVRSFNILKALSEHYDVHLGTFIDQEEDWQYLGELDRWCASVKAIGLKPKRAKLASLRGLLSGEALSLPYYRDPRMQAWVSKVVDQFCIDRVVVFSGVMAQYVDTSRFARSFVDFCDVDSAKWAQYAVSRIWPMSWLYFREGRLLGQFERQVAADADYSSFVTQAECQIFLEQAEALRPKVVSMENGVDTEYFSPANGGARPFTGSGPHLVLTGAMDYWPNEDAARWFANDVMPLISERFPGALFHVVGMKPGPAVKSLEQLGNVNVTGQVPDVRPYIHHADVVVAPLRVARGIQNKVLEAMAMARPVVVSAASAAGLRGEAGTTHEVATTSEEFAEAVARCLNCTTDSMGRAAREAVLTGYSWPTHMRRMMDCLVDEVRA